VVLAVAARTSVRTRLALIAGALALTAAAVGIAQIPKAEAGKRPAHVQFSRDAEQVLPLDAEIGRGPLTKPRPKVERSLLGGSGRGDAWRGALNQAADRPLLGYGFGAEEHAFTDRYYSFHPRVPENSYIGLGLQLGVAGVALVLPLVRAIAAAAVQAVRRASDRGLRAPPQRSSREV